MSEITIKELLELKNAKEVELYKEVDKQFEIYYQIAKELNEIFYALNMKEYVEPLSLEIKGSPESIIFFLKTKNGIHELEFNFRIGDTIIELHEVVKNNLKDKIKELLKLGINKLNKKDIRLTIKEAKEQLKEIIMNMN